MPIGMQQEWKVAALYHFAEVPDPDDFGDRLLEQGKRIGLVGTFIVAGEGINGTVAGTPDAIDEIINTIRNEPGFVDTVAKFSSSDLQPFSRFKIKRKPEIVTFRQDGLDPTVDVGTYVEPKDWNALINDPEVILIDTRNDYEYEVGKFKGAIDPNTKNFVEFTEYVQEHLDPKQHKKVAMYCTGGIRCEKATALLKREGFENVYHLHGGILKYLEEVPQEETTWEGACFVFDDRVALDHDLKPADGYFICDSCYKPYKDICPRCNKTSENRVKKV